MLHSTLGLQWFILGDSGRNVSIVGGDNISHCETRSSCEHVPNSELLPWWSCLHPVHCSSLRFCYEHIVPNPCRVLCNKTIGVTVMSDNVWYLKCCGSIYWPPTTPDQLCYILVGLDEEWSVQWKVDTWDKMLAFSMLSSLQTNVRINSNNMPSSHPNYKVHWSRRCNFWTFIVNC